MTEQIDWREEIEKRSHLSEHKNAVMFTSLAKDLFSKLESQHKAEIAELKEKSKTEAVEFFKWVRSKTKYNELEELNCVSTSELYDKFKKERGNDDCF